MTNKKGNKKGNKGNKKGNKNKKEGLEGTESGHAVPAATKGDRKGDKSDQQEGRQDWRPRDTEGRQGGHTDQQEGKGGHSDQQKENKRRQKGVTHALFDFLEPAFVETQAASLQSWLKGQETLFPALSGPTTGSLTHSSAGGMS